MAGHVYVSYGRQDVAYVRRLVENLAGEGLNVWADENVAPQAWWDASMEPPIRAAAAVLVVMTPASQSSDRVRGEITYAHRIGRPIIPLLLSGKAFFSQGGIPAVDVVGGVLPDDVLLGHLGALTGTPIPRRSTGRGQRGTGPETGGYGAAAGGGYGAAPTSGYAAGAGRGGYGTPPGGAYGAAPTSGYAAGSGGYPVGPTGAPAGGGYGAAPTSGYATGAASGGYPVGGFGLGPAGGFGSAGFGSAEFGSAGTGSAGFGSAGTGSAGFGSAGTGADAQTTGILSTRGPMAGAPGSPRSPASDDAYGPREAIYYAPVTGAPVSYGGGGVSFGPGPAGPAVGAYGDDSTGILSPGGYGGGFGPGGPPGGFGPGSGPVPGPGFGPGGSVGGGFGGANGHGSDALGWSSFSPDATDEDGPAIGTHAAPRRRSVPMIAGASLVMLLVVVGLTVLILQPDSSGSQASSAGVGPLRTVTSADTASPAATTPDSSPSPSPHLTPTKAPTKTPTKTPSRAPATTTTPAPAPPPAFPKITVDLPAPPLAVDEHRNGTVTIASAYGSDLTFTLTTDPSSGVVMVSATVVIPAGQKSQTFDVKLNAPGTVTVTATAEGHSGSASVTY